jgi:NADH-quinone oxidoreductase subunit N
MNALLVVCSLGFISLISEVVNLKKGLHPLIIVGLLLALVFVVLEPEIPGYYFSNMLVFDKFAIALTGLMVVTAAFWFSISGNYFLGQSHQTDRSALILFCMVGGIMMLSFHNMTVLFLGIEILSISLYVLAGSSKESFFSNEAAFKYFIMGSFATGFLLMGMALVYGAAASFDISIIAAYVASNPESLPGFFYVGLYLMLIGLAFKMSVVPFHFWAPDVYSGSPTAITAFMSTVVKIAAVGAFVRIFGQSFFAVQFAFLPTLQVIIVFTLVVANVTAVYQRNIKRMLAYSSIGHVGYILLGFISIGTHAFEPTLFYYLASYAVTTLLAFGCLGFIERTTGSTSVEAFSGLYKKNRFVAICMMTAMLSLAGIPPLSGFFAKYIVLGRAIDGGHIWLVVLAVITSLIGVYYYFRPVIGMFGKANDAELQLPFIQKVILAFLAVLTVLLGIFPDFLFQMAG